VEGSPFPSGGHTPVSIDIRGFYVYVVNKSQDPIRKDITKPPNYTTFILNHRGELIPIPFTTFETTPGSSPSQILISRDGKFAFGNDFLGFSLTPSVGSLQSFPLNLVKLEPSNEIPLKTPGAGATLGLWQHPKANVLYVGFVLDSQVGIYNINDRTGELSLSSTIDVGLAVCWIRTTKDGKHLYAVNAGPNSVSIYDSSDPLDPKFIDEIFLKEPGPNFEFAGFTLATSEAFSIALSPSEDFIYIVSQHSNPDFSIGNYNFFHILERSADGKLTENTDPLQLPVPNIYRPQGTAVIQVDNDKC